MQPHSTKKWLSISLVYAHLRTVNYVILKRQVKRTSQEGVRFSLELAQKFTTGFNTHLQEAILTGGLSILYRNKTASV